MCFVLCDDAADVDANADAMNCFFFILSAPLFASSVHTSARSSTIPSKENIQQMFLGYTHCDAIFRVIIGDFFFVLFAIVCLAFSNYFMASLVY